MLNSSDILRGYTDTIILAQLAEGDSYGYVISKNVQEITRGELQLWLQDQQGDPGPDGPEVRAERSDPVYDIQAAGNGRHD